ncbi:MAG: electron transfer flavoprotein subunit beta/FixA family protein [Candidatus Kariarchaeaceae archaeon]|jgi:electron transfer flavoprotein beta subunit
MKLAVLLKEVVDLVEELTVLDDGTDLDRDYLSFRSNEFDDYALVEALRLKQEGTSVDVYAIDGTDTDQMLSVAAARGADRLVKVSIEGINTEEGVSSRIVAQAFSKVAAGENYDMILTGVQGVDDLDGTISGHLAQAVGWPSLSVVVQVDVTSDQVVTVLKEFPGGILGEYEVELPAVLGIQASKEPPSYLPISKIRRAAQEATIEEKSVVVDALPVSLVKHVAIPVSGDRAEMISGELDEQVSKVIDLLTTKGILS